MNDFIKTKRSYIIALAVLFVFVSLSETTYSLFIKSDDTEEFNYNTGLLDLEFVESPKLVLENVFPVNDSDGMKNQSYLLKLKNTGTIPYLFDLKMISDNIDNSIDYKYIKVSVDDSLPSTLYKLNNVISGNRIIYPGEETSFNIKIWLDKDTPNDELGKSFNAKIVTSGKSIYKTLDASGANRPIINDNLIPIYYNQSDNNWYTADKNNLNNNYKWYDYDSQMWANVVSVKDSDKYIFDITRNNDIKVNDLIFNNSNLIIEDKSLDIGLNKYNYSLISNIFRVKFNDDGAKKYIISNGNISYYYDFNTHKFNFISNGNMVSSNVVNIDYDKWYIIGYTYNGGSVNFYLDGNNIGRVNLTGNIISNNSFKVGTNSRFDEISKMTIGNIMIYNRILSDNEIKNNYSTSINVINNGLIAGYSEFIPMTINKYYNVSNLGTMIKDSDIIGSYVWIPRFKYMVWNVLGEDNNWYYDVNKNGINISFENGVNTSGVIKCNNDVCSNDFNTNVSSVDNGKYYTHRAFSKVSGEVTGFWVGKYEVSSNLEYSILTAKDYSALHNQTLSYLYDNIKKMGNNYYVIKNSDWGAILYLAYSKYGVCKNNNCKEITPNETYIAGNNSSDSTTGNMYGVFDMAGASTEYMMTGYANLNGEVNFNSNVGMPISNDDYEVYYKNKFLLGDATQEFGIKNDTLDTEGKWIIRGGNITGNHNGIYAFGVVNDNSYDYISTRIVIK